MKNKKIFLLFLFLIITMGAYAPFFIFAQTIDIDEVTPLVLLKGRVFEMSIGSKEYLILSSGEGGKNYLLETNFRKELSGKLKEIAVGNWEVEISGISKGYKEFTVVEFKSTPESTLQEEEVKKEGKKIILPIIDVVNIHSINKDVPPQEPPNLFTTFSVPPDFQKEYSAPFTLKRIKGKVNRCNFKSVIPTLELEGKRDFAVMIPADVEAIKAVGENLMAFKPKDVIKEGTEVEIWYEEKGDLNTARIITIQEKDIASQLKQEKE